jgi:hypothetical protein
MSQLPDLIAHLYSFIDSAEAEQVAYYAHYLANYVPIEQLRSSLNVSKLLSGMHIENMDATRALSKLLLLLLAAEDFPVIYERFSKELVWALESTNVELNRLAIDIIVQCGLLKGHGRFILIELKDFATKLLQLLRAQNTTVSFSLFEGLEAIDSETRALLVPKLQEIYTSSNDPVIQFRLLELFMSLGAKEEGCTALLNDFVKASIAMIANDNDQLIQANAILTVEQCISSARDFNLFCNFGLITVLLEKLPATSEAPIPSLSAVSRILDVLTHCVKAKAFDAAFFEENHLTSKLRICLDMSNELINSSAIYLCACLASQTQFSSLIRTLLPFIEEGLFHGVSSVQLAALNGLGVIFEGDLESAEGSLKFEFLGRLQARTGGSLFGWLEERCKSQFVEQQHGAYFALRGILSSTLGLKIALDTSTILAQLLNRESDASLEGLKYKFGILEAIYTTPELCGLLNAPLAEQLRVYLGRGVVFVPRTTRVAFEAQ